MKRLAACLKTAIEKHPKMSIRNLERLSGISNSEICKLLSGKRITPNPLILKKIAPFLNLDYLFLYYLAGFIDEKDWDKFKTNKFLIEEDQLSFKKAGIKKNEGLLMSTEEFQLLTYYRNISSKITRKSILHISGEASTISTSKRVK